MSNEVAIPVSTGNENRAKLETFASGNMPFISSFDVSTPQGKVQLYNASNASDGIADHIGKTINLAHYAIMTAEINDTENPGSTVNVIRTVLIDNQGNTYSAVSDQLFASLQKIVAIFGDPSGWDSPLPIKVVEQRSNRGFRFYTIVLATE